MPQNITHCLSEIQVELASFIWMLITQILVIHFTDEKTKTQILNNFSRYIQLSNED